LSFVQKQTGQPKLPFPLILLALLLVAVPVVELSVLVAVADRIGVLTTVALVILASIVGAWLARREGMAAIRRLRQAVDAGRTPVREVFDGACVLVAGAMLILPGFVTDIVGALLLLPPTRSLLYRLLGRRLEARAARRGRPAPGPARPGPEDVIEGDFEEIEGPVPPPRGGWGKR
jgi:UPF0716 protein FxsA